MYMSCVCVCVRVFYEEIRTIQCLSNISFCSLRILSNSKLIFVATLWVTNAVVVTRVHCARMSFEYSMLFPFSVLLSTQDRTIQYEIHLIQYLNRDIRRRTFGHKRPAKIRISLDIRAV